MTIALRPRALRTIAALAAAPLAFIACGGDDDDDTAATDAVATTEDASAATTEAAADTTVADTTPATEATVAETTPDSSTPETTTPDTDAATETTTGAGVPFTSAEGDYSVVFPEEPTVQTQPQPLPDGNTVELVLAGVTVEDGFLATARGQYPDGYVLDPPVALQGAQDQALANVGGTLVSSQDITLQGRPGREFTATLTSGGESGTILQRIYLDGLVIYQQVYTGAGEATFADPELATFFQSFAFATG
jgi:hypothetical protein